MSEDLLKKRKDKLFKRFGKKNIVIYLIVVCIAFFGYYVRTRNLHLLKDITTGKYIPLALDPHVFLRYVKYIIEHGTLFSLDTMRYYPVGFNMGGEVPLLQQFIAYLYKFLHFFDPSVTVEKAHILYPPICFVIGLVFFFLTIKRLFDYRVALISSAILTVVPPFLYRTMAGFSDKEALAVMFIFMTFYLFVRSWQEKTTKKTIGFAIIAGVTLGFADMSWGGTSIVYMIIGLFGFFGIILNRFSKKDFYMYSSWFLSWIFILQFSRGGGSIIAALNTVVTSSTSTIVAVAFFMGLVDFLLFKKDILKIKDKVREKIPLGFASFLISVLLLVILSSIFIGPSYIFNTINHVFDMIVNPLNNRWIRTVAESHEPYITDWIGQMSFRYIMLIILGSSLLVYESIRSLKKRHSIPLVAGYTGLLLLFIFSRYSSGSPVFNGVSQVAKIAFLGSGAGLMVGLIIFYLYAFYKDKDSYSQLLKIKKEQIFVIVWFVIMIMSARRAARLIFIFAPVTTVFFGYISVSLFDYARKFLKKDWLKLIAYVLIGLLVVSTFYGFAKITLTQAKYIGPSYNQQWQIAGQWIRDNTNEDSVFAHWWDYGYWVQTGGERTTITDGGNAIGYFNYLMGRHVLTGQTEEEPLPFLYSHNATHLLIISDEIGKYPAFSSIGSDENYDRYSWINQFILDEKNVQELRDKVVYLYRGGTLIDDDIIYEDKLFPKLAAGIGGFFVGMKHEGNSTSFERPQAILMYNGKQTQIPLNCLFMHGQEVTFGTDGLDGCLLIIPKIDGQKMNPIGAAFYLSPKVKNSRVSQLYLMGKQSEYFKLVYSDKDQMPLSIYNGRTIGPLKIWEITYPKGLQVPDEFYGTTDPNPNVQY